MCFNMKKPAAGRTARGPRECDHAGQLIDAEDSEALLRRQARVLANRFRISPHHATTIAALAFAGGAR